MGIEQYKIPTRNETINKSIPEAKSYEEFEWILKKTDARYTPVTDINDISFIIDGNKFAIGKKEKINEWKIDESFNNVQLCYVNDKATLEAWISQFIKDDITKLEKEVKVQIGENEAIVNTQPWSQTNINQPTNFEYTDEGIKTFFDTTEKLREDIVKDYEQSLKLINKERKKLDNDRVVEENMLKLLKFKAEADLDDINDIIKVREKYLKKDREKQTNQDSRKESTENLYLQLKKYREEWTKLSSFLNSPAALNNFENIPAHDMRIPMRKKDEAKLLRNVYNNMAIETKKIDEMLLDANFEKVKNDHEQTLADYLKEIEKGATKDKFIPSPETKQIFNNLIKSYPELEKYTNIPTNKPTENILTQKEQEKIAIELANNPEFIKQHPKQAWWLLDRLTPGFATEWIDNTNMSPETKERMKTGIWLALLIGAGILAWKTASTAWKGAFSKDKLTGSDRWILAAGTAV